MATLLQQSRGARVEVAKSPLFSRKIKKVSVFINVACLYLRMKMIKELKSTKMVWVLSYVQGGIAETWKNNLLDELSKKELEVKMVKELFSKMRNKFRKTAEEERKMK